MRIPKVIARSVNDEAIWKAEERRIALPSARNDNMGHKIEGEFERASALSSKTTFSSPLKERGTKGVR